MHASVDIAEYCPAAQGVHDIAPVLIPVFVSEPASQTVHVIPSVEYFPAAQRVHDIAPVLIPVSVSEPASQTVHAVSPSAEYCPAAHAVQAEAEQVEVVLSQIQPSSSH